MKGLRHSHWHFIIPYANISVTFAPSSVLRRAQTPWGRMIKRPVKLFITLFWLSCICADSWAADVIALKSLDIRPYKEALEGFRDSCGCTVTEMTLPEEGHDDLTSRILAQNPAAVLAVGIDALERLQLIRNIPVFYTMVPSSQGIPPGAANISGASTQISPERNLAAILEVMPDARRIGVIFDPRHSERLMNDAMAAAQARGVQLVLRRVSKAGEVPPALEGLRQNIDVLWMVPDATVINAETVKQMFLFSFQNRVPVFTFSKKFVEMGAVAALNVVPHDIGAQAGELAVNMLRDRQKGPVRMTARRTSLVINGKVARKLGLKLSGEVLRKAEDVGH